MAARSSLLRRIAALAALAPRLVRLAHHDYPDRLLREGARKAREGPQVERLGARGGDDGGASALRSIFRRCPKAARTTARKSSTSPTSARGPTLQRMSTSAESTSGRGR